MSIVDKILTFTAVAVFATPCTIAVRQDMKAASRAKLETAELVDEITNCGFGDVAKRCRDQIDDVLDCLRDKAQRLRNGENIREVPQNQVIPSAPVNLPYEDTFERRLPSSSSSSTERREPQYMPGSMRSLTDPYGFRDPGGLGRRY